MKIYFNNILPFNLEIIADGGQAFRWNRSEDGKYIGVVEDYVFEVVQANDELIIDSNLEGKKEAFAKEYFDLSRDYEQIEKELMCFKEVAAAVNYCSGYRILFQDPWETTISFIISANNHIRNIKNTIENMCKIYGEPLEYGGKTYYSFPSPNKLASLSEDELKKTKCGYRAKYIIETARIIADGKVDLYDLRELPIDEAREVLLTLPGVGRKVADCIMLYSMRKFDAFPIDVWIKRVLEHIYFSGNQMPIKKLQKFAEEKFGDKAGFMQQYLFYYSRNCLQNIIK
ncbi:MAG: DNA-3-methyladenine glycosylase 2 [Tepidanaerobacter acetatoxydans]|uniref:DNA-3-methyladenine glycosylase family protein n=1 Tax=Tepidanaerobacter acetatoxydans TaxID=499229 RepID=UPI0026F302B8|nr:DNA glycosylase [Tepidanaerobacter acetatoxydans]NLU10690.1 DNA-3-methyladenine glycosylase 2 [Tepidanaerobacter acetatoxydans]